MRRDNPAARQYYIQEAADQMWSSRQLERNIQSRYYERLLKNSGKTNPASGSQRKEESGKGSIPPAHKYFPAIKYPIGGPTLHKVNTCGKIMYRYPLGS